MPGLHEAVFSMRATAFASEPTFVWTVRPGAYKLQTGITSLFLFNTLLSGVLWRQAP
jgi:hypothetical protein